MMETQRLATVFGVIARHLPEGTKFKKRVEETERKLAVVCRDTGSFDWTKIVPQKPTNRQGH